MRRLFITQIVSDRNIFKTVNTTSQQLWLVFTCIAAFILCVAISVAPLQRWATVSVFPTNLLTTVGSWLPSNFHILKNVQDSKLTTSNGEFLLLMALLFVIYGLCAWRIWSLQRVAKAVLNTTHYTCLLVILFASITVAGLIFVFTPALPSFDIFTYADYGRSILVHHANPYFVTPLKSSPNDIITRTDNWNFAIAAYGPLWLLICSCVTFVTENDPLHYLLAFRILGLIAHLLNTALIAGILVALRRPKGAIVLGVFLYAFNPLVLLESCLSGHNDVFVDTCTLLGIWFIARNKDKNMTHSTKYIPALLAFLMAVLIKFTAAPILLLFILFLLRKTLYSLNIESYAFPTITVQHWLKALKKAAIVGIICGVVMLIFYGPFWLGHSISAINKSFSAPPSSYYAENSLLRAILEEIKSHGFPSSSSWLYKPSFFLSKRATWDKINLAIVGVTLLVGAVLLIRIPTLQRLVVATLITLEAVLIVTPWFYSWYVLWLIPLAILLLVGSDDQTYRAIILFAFVFSISAFFTYIRQYYLNSFESGAWTRYLLTDLPPFIALCICFLWNKWVARFSYRRNAHTLS